MLKALGLVKKAMPELLRDPNRWKTLDVNYETPRVERVWTTFNEFRVYMHKIYPCQKAYQICAITPPEDLSEGISTLQRCIHRIRKGWRSL